MNLSGKLIVIEGTDGSGKATQTKLLQEYLLSKNQKVEVFDFPRYETFFGDFVGRYLRGELGDPATLSPLWKSLPYALDRFGVREDMKNALKAGKTVLCNRYTISNMAHQSTTYKTLKDRKEFWEWLKELEYTQLGLPKEDLVIFLHVPSKIAQDLTKQKGDRAYLRGKKQDVHEEDLDYLTKVELRYLELCQIEKHWRKMHCVDENSDLMPIKSIHQLILDTLKSEYGI